MVAEAGSDLCYETGDQLSSAGQIHSGLPLATCSQIRARSHSPAAQEVVLGIVIDVRSDNFVVDIGRANFAYVTLKSGEGSHLHSRPKFSIGSLVLIGLSRVTSPGRLVGTCTDNCEYWRGLGPLSAGYKYMCSKKLSYIMSLPYAERFLQHLGKFLRYEIAVGCNKCLWVTSSSAAEVFLVKSALGECRWFSPVCLIHWLKLLVWRAHARLRTHSPTQLFQLMKAPRAAIPEPCCLETACEQNSEHTLGTVVKLSPSEWILRTLHRWSPLTSKNVLPDAFHHIDASDIVCCDTSTNSLREVPIRYGVVFLVESGVAKEMYLRLNPRLFHF